MKINQSNYEIFFLDYLDGKLPAHQVDDFLDFLKNNPELKEELKAVEGLKLHVEEFNFPEKEKLLRGNDQENSSFDYRAVAFMEGILSHREQDLFLNEMRQDPQKENEFNLLLSTKLKKEYIQFPHKEKLYRKSKRISSLYWLGRIAAIIVLVMTVWALNRNEYPAGSEPLFSESITPVIQTDKGELTINQEPVKRQDAIDEINNNSKDTIPQKTKSIREKTKGRLKEVADLIPVDREDTPQAIAGIPAKLQIQSDPQLFALSEMPISPTLATKEYLSLDQYLAQRIFSKKKDQPVDKRQIANASLRAVSQFSNEKVEYKTDGTGKVSEISLNTYLLAFSIPLGKNK